MGTNLPLSRAVNSVVNRSEKRVNGRGGESQDTIKGIEVSDSGAKIERKLLSSYTNDVDKIWKNIGIEEHKSGGKLDGFKVNFVKKGSVFEKLGLKRG